MKSTAELMKELLSLFFEENNLEKIITLLTSDIHCYGLANDRIITDREQVVDLLNNENYQKFKSYQLSFFEENEISDNTALVGFSLSHEGVTVEYRLTGNSRLVNQENKLYMLHFSLINPYQTYHLFSDIAGYKLNQARQELLDAATPGGMMGGYIEEGFPFYYINQKMLDYLEYENEEDFVRDIKGLIINCMHPADRAYVDKETEKQIAETGEYQIEYRMRKKDGSYIWVHDIGKKVVAEDGRDAILSVCYDITKEKSHTMLVENLVDTMDGGIVLYEVEKDWNLTPIYISAGVGGISNRSNEEYTELCEDNVLDSIYFEDRKYVQSAFQEAITKNIVTSLTYRVPNKNGGYVWINGVFSNYGEQDGKSVLRAIFTPVSIQYDLQLQALNQNTTGICIIDANTNELYYTNEASFALHGAEPFDYVGKKCYEALCGSDHICSYCWRDALFSGKSLEDHVITADHKILSIHAERRQWNDREVLIEYMRDITKEKEKEMQLMRDEKMNELSCNFAGMWTWMYNVETGTCYTCKKLQEEFGLPAVLEHYPDKEHIFSLVLPEHISIYSENIDKIKAGEKKVEFEVQVYYADKSIHWLRYGIQRLDINQEGEQFAVGTAIPIDTEKAMEARIELEEKKQTAGEKGLLAHSIVNLTKNKTIEHLYSGEEGPSMKPGSSLEEGSSC